MDPFERFRSAGRRVSDPVESLAHVVAERVIELVIQSLDMNEIIRHIDLTAALDQVDLNHVLDRVDVTEVLDRVDVDRLLDRVDVNGLLDRVDVDAIVRRADVGELLDRVDVNGLVNRIDVDTLVGQTDLGSIIARSTSGFASQGLDVLRAQAVMIDQFTDRVVWRIERRKGARPQGPYDAAHEPGPPAGAEPPRDAGPPGPAAPRAAARVPARADPPDSPGPLESAAPAAEAGPAATADKAAGAVPAHDAAPPAAGPPWDAALPAVTNAPHGAVVPQSLPRHDSHPHQEGSHIHGDGTRDSSRHGWISMQGHYAGGASRLAAWVIDVAAIGGAFTIALAAVSYAASIITGHTVTWNKQDILVAAAFIVWAFVYFAYPWSLSGKSLGMALLGIRVVGKDGTAVGLRRAVTRTLALPLSFLLFGLGLAGIIVQRQNRALHDFIAGTVVIYSWDARAARIRSLVRTADAKTGQVPRES